MKFDSPEKTGRWLRPIGLLTAIPFVLLFGPLIGYFIGDWLDKKFDTAPWLMSIFVGLGFIAAGREVWGLIKRSSRESEDGQPKG